ncbi:MAG: hypothetical protein KDK72_02155, partial [Chlamydiia bacterium]|nr:hypothetical protein [Chlamydiia bacterium]
MMTATITSAVRDVKEMFVTATDYRYPSNYWRKVEDGGYLLPLCCLKCNQFIHDIDTFGSEVFFARRDMWFCPTHANVYCEKVTLLKKIDTAEGNPYLVNALKTFNNFLDRISVEYSEEFNNGKIVETSLKKMDLTQVLSDELMLKIYGYLEVP